VIFCFLVSLTPPMLSKFSTTVFIDELGISSLKNDCLTGPETKSTLFILSNDIFPEKPELHSE
ncbi:hypothetical protein O6490_24980, partial [Salmonella enterica subsp. enterica]